MQYHVKLDGVAGVIANLRDIGNNQIPFALASALTKTVKAEQPVIWALLPERFTIRRLAWARSGIRITVATKQHFEAAIEDINKYMELQQVGGTKFSLKGMVAIPLSGARPMLKSLIHSGDFPAQVMQHGGFIVRKDKGTLIMYRVVFKGNRMARRMATQGMSAEAERGFWLARQHWGIIPMYALVMSARIPRRYGFVEAMPQQRLESEFEKFFTQQFEEALRTKR